MSDRDRSNQDRGFENPSRRDTQGSERPTGSPRSRQYPDDDESFDLPAWSEPNPRSGSRDQSGRPATSRKPIEPEHERRPSGRREPIPQLGEAFKRPGRRAQPEYAEETFADSNEPYDRLRRVAAKPPRQVEFDDEPDGYDDAPFVDEIERYPVAPRGRDSRRRANTGRAGSGRQAGPPRTPATQQLGGLISAAAPQTRFAAAVLGIGLLSLVFMAATVAGRMNSLPDWMPIHFNAEGTPDRWGTSSTLWRIPVLVFFVTLMSIVVAWGVGKRDVFAVRFSLGSTLLIHVLCWIALINLAW